jgi:hypothetical protein
VPLVLALLLFVSAGSIAWTRGWLFILVFVAVLGAAVLYLWRINPENFGARSRIIREGTKRWDRILLGFLFPAIRAIFLVAALDDGRFHPSTASLRPQQLSVSVWLTPLPIWIAPVSIRSPASCRPDVPAPSNCSSKVPRKSKIPTYHRRNSWKAIKARCMRNAAFASSKTRAFWPPRSISKSLSGLWRC